MPLSLFQKTKYKMMRLMAGVAPSCKDISALLSQGMDQRLPLTKRLSIRMHVSMCSFCRRYEKQLLMLRQGARRYADPDENEAADSLSPEAKERLRATLERGRK